jgi:hypothetical protein
MFSERGLIRQSQQSLQNCAKAHQDHQQFEQLVQPGVRGEPVDCPKADRPDDNNDQNTDQDRNGAHLRYLQANRTLTAE